MAAKKANPFGDSSSSESDSESKDSESTDSTESSESPLAMWAKKKKA